MGILLFVIWIVLFFLSFKKRSDLFTPMRLFLVNIFVFWGGIFYKDYTIAVYVYFILILVFAVIIWKIEGSGKNNILRTHLVITDRNLMWVKLWCLTLIPVVSQIILINKMGGLEGYIASIGLRVIKWQGLGIYQVFIRSMLVINLLYFVLLVKSNQVTKIEKIGFYIHFLIFILIALMTGSRSTLLVNLLLMFIIYYNYVRKVKVIKFVLLGVGVLLVAFIIGVARYGYSYNDGEFKTGLSDNSSGKKFETANFEYGLFPLETILDATSLKTYQYGSTYLSAVTNLIPRQLWPEKPNTGGVIFTNSYHDVHGGYSNYSTGFIVEGIINYGYFLGPILAFLLLYVIYRSFIQHYGKKPRFASLQPAIMYFLMYPCFLYLIPSYLHGEFTTVTHSILVNKILLIFVFVKIVVPKTLKYTEIE